MTKIINKSAKAATQSKKPVKQGKTVKPAKPETFKKFYKELDVAEITPKTIPERKRLSPKKLSEAQQRVRDESSKRMITAQARARRRASGIVDPELPITFAGRTSIALQVWTPTAPWWGTLKLVDYAGGYTGSAYAKQLHALEDRMMDWKLSDYFGISATFRIANVARPSEKRMY